MKIEKTELVPLRAIVADWRARNIKRASLPAGTTVRQMIERIETADAIVERITNEVGDTFVYPTEEEKA